MGRLDWGASTPACKMNTVCPVKLSLSLPVINELTGRQMGIAILLRFDTCSDTNNRYIQRVD